ncbi:MAG: DUF559 domain-containing protein, partial [Candidatus Omnitrophota bacterium]|nr:DUF559 domain-containing protein [Candidatus Omnitrophota bacterium]
DVGKKRDEARTKTLSEYGVRILRFSDLDILNNIEGVYEVICKETERDNAPSPHPSPLKRGEVDNV